MEDDFRVMPATSRLVGTHLAGLTEEPPIPLGAPDSQIPAKKFLSAHSRCASVADSDIDALVAFGGPATSERYFGVLRQSS